MGFLLGHAFCRKPACKTVLQVDWAPNSDSVYMRHEPSKGTLCPVMARVISGLSSLPWRNYTTARFLLRRVKAMPPRPAPKSPIVMGSGTAFFPAMVRLSRPKIAEWDGLPFTPK
jgi:hypothetical protein